MYGVKLALLDFLSCLNGPSMGCVILMYSTVVGITSIVLAVHSLTHDVVSPTMYTHCLHTGLEKPYGWLFELDGTVGLRVWLSIEARDF